MPILVTSLAAYLFDGQWRPVFFVLALPGFFGIWALWKFVSDSPKEMLDKGRLKKAEYEEISDSGTDVGQSVQQPKAKINYSIFLKDGYFYVYVIALFCQLMVYWGSTTWLTSFLVKQHGMNLKEMGFFASAPYIVAFFAMMLGGWLMDKVFHRMKPVAMIAYLGSIPVLVLLGTVEKGHTGLLLTMLLLSGFFINLNFGSIYAYLQKRYPKEIVGSATGLANGIGQMGSFVSPLIAGYLVKVGTDGSQDFSQVFMFFALASAMAALSSFLLKEKQIATSAVPPGKDLQTANL